MKDYKRLTARRNNFIYEECGNCPNVNKGRGCTDKKCYEIIRNRLAELEDKIESGELCDRKETAKQILDKVYDAVEKARLESEFQNEKGDWSIDEHEFMSEFTFGKLHELYAEYGVELFGKQNKS